MGQLVNPRHIFSWTQARGRSRASSAQVSLFGRGGHRSELAQEPNRLSLRCSTFYVTARRHGLNFGPLDQFPGRGLIVGLLDQFPVISSPIDGLIGLGNVPASVTMSPLKGLFIPSEIGRDKDQRIHNKHQMKFRFRIRFPSV